MKNTENANSTVAAANARTTVTSDAPSELGLIKIHDNVLAALVSRAVLGVDGVSRLAGSAIMDNLAGMNFNPTEYVDITDEIELKIEMLECHESQLKWMRDHDHIDFADFVRTCSKFRGLQCGVDYAEAFTQEYVWLKVVAKRLLP